MLAFVMLNPSRGDAETDDPTIRRCMGFARRDGFGGICVFNLCAFRATDPRQLRAEAFHDPTEMLLTEQWLAYAGTRFTKIVCAWGNVSKTMKDARVDRMVRALGETSELLCLGRTGGGQPRHPLYVKKDQPLLPF